MEGRKLSIPLKRRPLLGWHCFMTARGGGMAGGDLRPSRSGPWAEAAQRSDDEIPWPVAPRGCGNPIYYAGSFNGERSDGEGI
jgi:hypothetical protein